MSATPYTFFIIEDDPIMAECIARACSRIVPPTSQSPDNPKTDSQSIISPAPKIQIFSDTVSAINALDDGLPDLILLDVLLNGPDGFTFLNEIISYPDSARIPVIIITSLNLSPRRLSHYGVRAILNKETMTPAEIQTVIQCAIGAREEP